MKKALLPSLFLFGLVLLWQALSSGSIPAYILPSPLAILASFAENFETIAGHSLSTLAAAGAGLGIAVVLALVCAVLMDSFAIAYRTLYPVMVLSQTVPLIALAPLFILWFGFGLLPKVISVVLLCFFPILINTLKSFQSLDTRYANLMRSMGATQREIIRHVKLPGSLPAFFAGLRIAATYSVVAAVIGEWLGGAEGIGVYLIRSQKSFATSQLFASILAIMLLSLVFFLIVRLCERICVLPRKARS